MSGVVEWIIFIALSATAVVTTAGMLLTMSMYRAGLALMSSFVALAGLFILLDADLLAAIQIMMNVGGMMVMVLFMVMMMMDPGGEMMWDMKRRMNMRGPGAFSMSMPPPDGHQDDQHEGQDTDGHEGHQREQMDHQDTGDGHMMGMSPQQHHQMMADMAMSTNQLPLALVLGSATAVVLGVLVARTPWPVSGAAPDQVSVVAVGNLLLSRYMIAFEGAAFLILAGIVAAIIFGKREGGPPPSARPSEPEEGAREYTCPMHPEVRQEYPGQCPICGMDLVPVEETAHGRGHEYGGDV